MPEYLVHYVILLCIFTCVVSPDSETSEGLGVGDTKNVKTAIVEDSPSATEIDNSSRLDKKNGEKQLEKQLPKPNGSNVTNQNNSAATITPTATGTTVESASTEVKFTSPVNSEKDNKYIGNRNIGTGAVIRGFYVFVGLGAIVVMYIVVRTIRLKRKKTTVRKYGVLANREDVEMTPLGAEDEEEESTLFDMTKSRP